MDMTMQQLADALEVIRKGAKADVVYTTYGDDVLEFIIGWYGPGNPAMYNHAFAVSEIKTSDPDALIKLLITKATENRNGSKSTNDN